MTLRVEESIATDECRALIDGTMIASGPRSDLVSSGDIFVVHSNGDCGVAHVYVDYLAIDVVP